MDYQTQQLLESLRVVSVGNWLNTPYGNLLVRRTSESFNCESCALFEDNKCICPKWRKNAVCFANERPDKQSVFFRKVR